MRHKSTLRSYLPNARLGGDVVGTGVQPTPKEAVDRVDVDAVHFRPVVREHRRQRPPDNLAPVDDGDDLPVHVPAHGLGGVVAPGTVLEDLHDRQGRAREQALEGVGGMVQEPDVSVQVGPVHVTEALDVAPVADRVPEVVVLRGAAEALLLPEDGVVHDDPVHAGVVVGIPQRPLNVDRVGQFPKLVPQPVGAARLPRPFGVLLRGRIRVRQ